MVDGQITIERHRKPLEDCELYEGLHPPLISEEVFYKAQEFIRNNRARPVGERHTVKSPLAGIVICAKCGHRMVRRPYNDRDYPDTLMCADTACDNVSVALHLVEERILESLRDWLDNFRLEWEVEGRASDSAQNIALKEKALRRLEKEYETLNKQLDNAHDLLEQGIYTTDQFLDRSRKLSERIKQNEADRAALSDDIAVDKSREAGRSQIVPKIEKLLDVYWSLPTPKAKNDMLKAVVEKVVYLKERSARYKGNSPDDFEITIYPRIPKA